MPAQIYEKYLAIEQLHRVNKDTSALTNIVLLIYISAIYHAARGTKVKLVLLFDLK